MQFLIRSAHVIDAASSFDGQVVDILVENGVIQQIGQDLSAPADSRVIESANLHVSPGWVDMRVLAQYPIRCPL
jgi:dihydroorotase